MMIHIALADDQLLFRKGMIALLNQFENTKVVLEAESGNQLLQQLNGSKPLPDLVLLDISMPDGNGLETLQQLKQRYPALRIIMLTIHEEEKFIVKLIDAGANAYLAKNTDPAQLEEAIRSVLATDFYFSQAMLNAMRHAYKYNKSKIQLDDVDGLTNREKEILLLICQEYTTPEIAARLFLSERTVEGHRNNLLQKTGARNAAGLVIYAIQKQLFEAESWRKEAH